jgi:hypothetical protein
VALSQRTNWRRRCVGVCRRAKREHDCDEINLEENEIGAEGASALADALKVNTSVAKIDLEGNDIGAEGASALAEALKVNITATDINCMFNKIGDAGASALADALEENKSVTNINLGYNIIGDEGASALANALKQNTSVTNIYLWDNRIGAEGTSALADALKVNTSMAFMNFEKNGVIVEDAALVNALLARNKRFRHRFLFDARRMLISVICTDWCGVVWPYLLDSDDLDVGITPDNIETLRAEFAAVVEERRRRAEAATH